MGTAAEFGGHQFFTNSDSNGTDVISLCGVITAIMIISKGNQRCI